MRFLYLRTVYWFNLKAGGSVGHTAGVINSMNNKVDLKVLSNDVLEGVKPDIDLLKPILIPFLTLEINEFLYNFKVIKKCKSYLFDCIYQRYSGFSFCGAYLAKQKKVPFILEFNSSDVWKIKYWKSNDGKLKRLAKYIYNKIFKLPIVSFIENYNLKNATYIVVVSKALNDTLIGLGVDETKIIVNPNGVDTEKYSSIIDSKDTKTKYNINDKIVLGFIGTFGQWHGAENIAKAYGKLLQRHPEFREKTKLLMVGDGVKMSEVKEIINDMDIAENVILTGLVPQSEGPKYLAACDILINATVPNPDGSEFFGSPTKLFEYMAMGKGIICSNMAQMAEILVHNKTAYMVKPGDIDELSFAMKELIQKKELREYLGKNSREEVLAKYTWDKHVERILRKIYE